MSNLTIFFDESGKNNDDKPHLMGALAIPDNVYNLQEFEELLFIVTQKEIHWKDFKGDSKEREIITKIIKTLLDHQPFIKMNVINYDQSMIQQQLNFLKMSTAN